MLVRFHGKNEWVGWLGEVDEVMWVGGGRRWLELGRVAVGSGFLNDLP